LVSLLRLTAPSWVVLGPDRGYADVAARQPGESSAVAHGGIEGMAMITKIAGLAVAMALPALAMAPAHAEESPCGCVQPLPTDGAPIGAVVSAGDDVLMSLPQGMAPAKAGSPLLVGSRLIAGPAGAATIRVG